MPDNDKANVRQRLKTMRRSHVAGLPEQVRALVFHRPPAAVARLVPEGAMVGLYFATPDEAPTHGYARWFLDNGRILALPRFADRRSPMHFAAWRDPHADSDLVAGPFGIAQPADEAPQARPDILFVPGVAFSPSGERLGQGGGHYDRWLAQNPDVPAFGLAWDCQIVEHLPIEVHDMRLQGVITPTRFLEGHR